MQRFITASLVSLVVLSQAARAQDLTKEQFEKLQKLYQDARGAFQEEKYDASNGHLLELLKLVPAPEGSSLDPNTSRIHYDIACNFALMENKAKALEHLEKAVEHGFWDHAHLERDSLLNALRDDKKFQEIVDRSRRGVAEMAFGLKDIHGKEIRREDYKGKVLVVDIWGTWCPPCRMEIPHFVRLQKRYGKEGLAVIGLTWEQRPPDTEIEARVRQFVAANEVNYTVAMIPPGVLRSIPEFRAFPTTLYIGRDGVVDDRVQGAEAYAAIERRASKLLQQKPPSPAPAETVDAAGE